MDSNFNNKVTQIVEIEDDVIDLDGDEKTPEEVIYEWDAKIRKKLSTFAVADNENILGDLMKEYFQSLQEMTRIYEDNETLKNKVVRHIGFLYLYYFELQCCMPDNYLNNMEDILTLYCNLELEVIRPLKKKDFSAHKYNKRIVSVSRQIINMLTVYLLERHDHILHVLMKMNTNNVSNSCSELLNVLYSHFLTKVPAFNLCDESFCRSYIVFQKWKEIRENEDWERMDKIMYKMFKRTPESVKNNENLRQILMPACQSTVDIVLNLFRSFRDISTAYFKHISAKKSFEMDDLDFNIDLGEDEPTILCDDENEEEVTFLKAYYEVERNMSNLSQSNDIPDIREVEIIRKCKEEFDEDDDVQFVGITMLPKQPLLDITLIDDEEAKASYEINNENENQRHLANEPMGTPPSILSPVIEKNPDLENLNGITRICVGSPRTVVEASSSCQTADAQTTINPSSPLLSSIKEMISECNPPELNQPKVTLVPNDPQISTAEISNTVNETNLAKKTVEMKSVEVQADIKNYVYNDYGLTTPPFDVPIDEQNSRPVEPRLYTDIGQNRQKELTPERENVCEKSEVHTRSVEVQVDAPSSGKDCPYNDYGLTPPNDSHLDDRGARLQETCLYANIVHKDLSDNKEKCEIISQKISTNKVEVPQIEDVAQAGVSLETESQVDDELLSNINKQDELDNCERSTEHGSEYDELENELDTSDVPHIDAECDNEIDTESCHTTDKKTPLTDETSNHGEATEQSGTINFEIKINPEFQVPQESFDTFKTSDQIDTGQKLILNTAPNIESVMDADSSETKDFASDTYNGNTVLKPLSSNRTNGQAKDVAASPAKIMYTSAQKIRAASLDDFSRFESAIHTQWSKMKENHDFDDILSGPVSKVMPTKHNNMLSSQDKLDIFGSQESNSKTIVNTNSRSNSPNDMTSPAYEAIDDFRNYFSDSVNGRVPPPHDVKVPQGILKKTNSTRRKNYRIMFHESTCDKSEERRHHSEGVLVPKRIRRDRKLNMVPRVVVEQLPFIEEEIEKVLNNPGTLRVDYDKTTNHISEKDVVRCISPPKLSWIVNLSSSRHNPGKVKSRIDVSTLCEKNKSSCCNQLAEEFTKLNCNVVEDDALILSIPNVVPTSTPVDPETEFSNSPTFLPDTDELVQHCLEETSVETTPDIIKRNASLLCDNSNFYTSQTCVTEAEDLGHNLSKLTGNNAIKPELVETSNLKDVKNPESVLISKDVVDDTLLTLPTAVPETYDFEKNLKNEVFSKIDLQSLDDSDGETRLPLKKRKLSVANKNENLTEEQKKEEISYPATPMISIAEVEALHPMKLQANNTRPFKTPAERKEMPPLPVFYNVDSDPSPIITDQFNINNHTYNNPTINYHMNNVPVPFINIPCGSYYSLPPILVPFNNMSTFEQSKINPQQQENYTKKENRKQGRQRKRR